MTAISDIKSLLTSEWNSSNTDNETPVIELVTEIKRVDLGIKSAILIYQINRSESEVSIGAGEKNITEYITIDIRTAKSRERMNKLRDEVERIIDNNVKSVSNWSFVKIDTGKDLSDKSRKLWRYIYDVRMQIIAKER